MESGKAIISETKDAIRNTILRAVGAISGCYGTGNDMRKLREIAKLYNSEDDFEELPRAKGIWGTSKM